MPNFNMMHFLLASKLAGKRTPKKVRTRAGLLAALSGDMVTALVAGKGAKAEGERDRAYAKLRELKVEPLELEVADVGTGAAADLTPDEVSSIRHRYVALSRLSKEERNAAVDDLLNELGVALDLVPAGAGKRGK